MVNHDTWSSIPQHKLTGTCEEPVNEVVALDVGSTANAPILSDRYTSAVPHTGTQMLLRSFDLNSATCNLIKSPYYQGTRPSSGSSRLFSFPPKSHHCTHLAL